MQEICPSLSFLCQRSILPI